MDQEKIKAMAEIMRQGGEVEFENDAEMQAVNQILSGSVNATANQKPIVLNSSQPMQKTNPAPQPTGSAMVKGFTPGIMDYAPIVTEQLEQAATFTNNPSELQKIQSRMTPKQFDEWKTNIMLLPDAERHQLLREMIKSPGHKQVEQNLSEREALRKSDPMGYGLGQMAFGLPAGMAGGALVGPSIAGQGLLGGALAFAQNPSPESALVGGVMGAGMAGLGKAAETAFRSPAQRILDNPQMADDMVLSGLGYDSKEILAMKRVDDYLAKVDELASMAPELGANAEEAAVSALASKGIFRPPGPSTKEIVEVARANIPWTASAQQGLENIQRPAMLRGSRGTLGSDLGRPPSKMVDAEMAPMPTTAKTQHPKTWMKPSGKSREIDLGWPNAPVRQPANADEAAMMDLHGESPNPFPKNMDEAAMMDANGEPSLWDSASNSEIDAMMPAHPAARRATVLDDVRPINAPKAEKVQLEMLEPEPPPLSPAERSVSDKLAKVASGGQGLDNKTGFQFVKPQSAISNAAIKRGPLAVGLRAPQKAQAMLDLLNSGGFKAGLGATEGSASKIATLIADVQKSNEPDLLDYLYKEMYPEYNLLSLAAEGKNKSE